MSNDSTAISTNSKSPSRPEATGSRTGTWVITKTLAVKELRETGWIAGIGLATYFLLVGMVALPLIAFAVKNTPVLNIFASAIGFISTSGERTFPFLSGGFIMSHTFISIGLAIALGLRQSLGETRGGTYNFLLHRPVSRNRLFLTKLAVGVVLLLACGAVPVIVYGCWAAMPGTHPAPFEWSMTLGAWKVWIAMPLVYLGAFLSGIRPARWLGTRLMPILGVGVPTLLAAKLPLWWLCGGPIIVLVSMLLVVNILWIGTTRDFS